MALVITHREPIRLPTASLLFRNKLLAGPDRPDDQHGIDMGNASSLGGISQSGPGVGQASAGAVGGPVGLTPDNAEEVPSMPGWVKYADPSASTGWRYERRTALPAIGRTKIPNQPSQNIRGA